MKTLAARPPAVRHYENFPVASWLCPPALRPAVAAIYWFARTADDLADEGDASAADRLDALARYRSALISALHQAGAASEWPAIFEPLGLAIRTHGLPGHLLHDLLDAFEQDVRMSDGRCWYPDRQALLDYCRRSANPVGRLLLHLYDVREPERLAQSDAICSALQLINFWQDLSVDVPRSRYYLPVDECDRHGVSQAEITQRTDSPLVARLIESQVRWARETMMRGAPLASGLPGRIGWELRLVVQGGLRILDKIDSSGFQTLSWRPRLRAWDLFPMAWRSFRMG